MSVINIQNNQESARDLFEKYYRLIPFLVGRMTYKSTLISEVDQEDIISKTYLILWEICIKQSQIQAQAFKSYVYIRIKGSIIDELRKKKKIHDQAIYYADYLSKILEDEGYQPSDVYDSSCSIERGELQKLLLTALDKLNPKEQTVISEFYLQEKKFCQIVNDHHGLSKSWVSKIHRQALKKLKELITSPSN